MDDTGLNEYPVIFLNIKNLRYDSKQYEDVDDAGVYILKVKNINIVILSRKWDA